MKSTFIYSTYIQDRGDLLLARKKNEKMKARNIPFMSSVLFFLTFSLSDAGFIPSTAPRHAAALLSIQKPRVSISISAFPQNNNQTSSLADDNDDGIFEAITAPGLIVGDLLSIAIACQLLGLVDVLSDSEFWKNGGWFQPVNIASSTSTLPALIQRFSISSISWIAAATVGKGISAASVGSSDVALNQSLKLLIPFAVILSSFEITSAYLCTGSPPDIIEICRLFYFTAISLVAARYLNSSIFY